MKISPKINSDKHDLIEQATSATKQLDNIITNDDTIIAEIDSATLTQAKAAIKLIAQGQKKQALYQQKIIKRVVQLK